ncbi:MAG: 30S ribosomal protein S20 [Alphaproteobacteria bacterium]|nr:30S ribosomal protein S20 [Alphaproteobacteria bacterium]MBQ8785143.1 30S ribosomal protein S20 [Alphaproteobacteria bacterium]MBR5482696.1 30S ribosomal protein S20 [Alphaproteobacteria bacterium]
MANHKSAKTRIKRNTKRSIINGARKSRVRTFVKKVEAAIVAKDKALAQTAFVTAESELMKAVNKGVMHRNTVARKISRLSAKIKAL